MLLDLDGFQRWHSWHSAMSVLERKEETMSWFRKGSAEEDKVVAEAGEVILDSLSNTDAVNKIEGATGRNLRDQLTIEEVEEISKESRLRGWGVGRN